MMQGKLFLVAWYLFCLFAIGLLVCCGTNVSVDDEVSSGQSVVNDNFDTPETLDTVLFPLTDTLWNAHTLHLQWYELVSEEKGGIKISIDGDERYVESGFDSSLLSIDHRGLLMRQKQDWKISQLCFVDDETFIFSVCNNGMFRPVIYAVNYHQGKISLPGQEITGQCYYMAYLPEQRKLLWHSGEEYTEEDGETTRSRKIWQVAVTDSGFVNKKYTAHNLTDVAETDSCLYPYCREKEYKIYYTKVLEFLNRKGD